MYVFEELDKALIEMETWNPRMSLEPVVWPSEASATLADQIESEGIGGCRRASYYRMTGQPITNPMDAVGAQVVRLGRAVEKELFEQATEAELCVATGVKYYVKDISLSFEMDGILLDKNTKQGIIAEVKSFDGYYATKQIVKEGRPKLEHVLQLVVYLNEVRTGKRLKEGIAICQFLAQGDSEGAKHKNRIKVYPERLEQMGDGELAGKLLYMARAGREKREFDIGIYLDPDGNHYPSVDGVPWKVFTIESIYNRFAQVQACWKAATDKAKEILEKKGVSPPTLTADGKDNLTEEDKKALSEYWDKVRAEIAEMDEFLPAADYQYKYQADKIKKLHEAGKIPDKNYKKWKAGHKILGAWQCLLPGSLIELDNGLFIPVQDTKRGQRTARGRIKKKISKPVSAEVVCLKPYNLLPLYLTADHEVKIQDSSFVKAGELVRIQPNCGGKRQYRHEVVVPFDMTERSVSLSNEDLFVIGLWLAEGHFAHKRPQTNGYYKIGFTLHPDEEDLAGIICKWAGKFKNHLGLPATSTDRVKTDPRNGNHYRVVTVNSMAAADFIGKYAGCGGARNKSILRLLQQATIEQQFHLLNGLIVGDGCCSLMRNTYMHSLTTVSVQLALQVQRLLWRQGKVAGIIPQEDSSGFRNGKMGTAYHVRWYDGKSYVSRIENGCFYTAIHQISRNIPYKGRVYDLSIERTQEIPTASGIVHNCRYCRYKNTCVSKEYPELRYMLLSTSTGEEEDE